MRIAGMSCRAQSGTKAPTRGPEKSSRTETSAASVEGLVRDEVEISGCGQDALPVCRQISPFRSACGGPPVEMTAGVNL